MLPLCKFCIIAPFVSLHPPPTPDCIGQVSNDLVMFVPDKTYNEKEQKNCEPLEQAFHKDIEALAISSKTCALCTVIQAGVRKRDHTLNEASRNCGILDGKVVQLRYSILPNARLWLTAPYNGARGFYAWAQHSTHQRQLSLMAAIGFSTISSKTPRILLHRSALSHLTDTISKPCVVDVPMPAT